MRTFSNHDTIVSYNEPIITNLKRTKSRHSRINQLCQQRYLCFHKDIFALGCCLRKNKIKGPLDDDFNREIGRAQTVLVTLAATTAALASLPAGRSGREVLLITPLRQPGAGSRSCQRATLSTPVPAPRSS